jgi:3-oxoacyl-[acyl-carrier-protein] synthase-3
LTDLQVYLLGTALGSDKVAAADLTAEYGPVREGFLEKTGFEALYRTTSDETSLTLALRAIGDDTAWWKPSVDAVISVTSTPDLVAPGNSYRIHSALDLPAKTMHLDLNDACTGFVRAMKLADSLIASSAATTILLVIADTYSKLFDPSQLKVSPLFSDGASALLISATPLPGSPVAPRNWTIDASWFHSEGSRASDLAILRGVEGKTLGALEMNGGAVFNFVLRNLEQCISDLTTSAGIQVGDVSRWYVHQGSRAVVDAVEKALAQPEGSLFRAGAYGNVVGSSLPFQIEQDAGDAAETIGLLGFGVGLTMAGMIITQKPAAA